jgi:hypothetical protein
MSATDGLSERKYARPPFAFRAHAELPALGAAPQMAVHSAAMSVEVAPRVADFVGYGFLPTTTPP